MARVTLTTRVAQLEARFDSFESKLDTVLAALTTKAPVTPVTPEAPVTPVTKKAKVKVTPATPATPATPVTDKVTILNESVPLGSIIKFAASDVHNARLEKSTETVKGVDAVSKAFGSTIVATLVGYGAGRPTRDGYRVFTVKTPEGSLWVKMSVSVKLQGTDSEWVKKHTKSA